MKLTDVILLSLLNLRGHAMRSLLTVAAVSIGIGSIVFLVALGFGLQRLAIDNIVKGSSLMTLDVSAGKSSLLQLNQAAIDKISMLPGVSTVSPLTTMPGQFSYHESATDASIIGVDGQYQALAHLTPVIGTFPADTTHVLISTTLAKTLGITVDKRSLDESIKGTILSPSVGGRSDDIGRYDQALKIGGFFDDSTPTGFVSVAVFHRIGIASITSAKVLVHNSNQINSVKSAISEQGFAVESITDMIGQIEGIFHFVEWVLGGFGLVALLVASIGMFNTLTITLLERLRDIGIMKALGARHTTIVGIFLVESTIMGTLGGLLGIVSATFVALLLNQGVNFLASRVGAESMVLFYFPHQFLLEILVVSMLLGLATGLYPALRAAKLEPLKALRYE